jgi:hypothetical protein
VGGPRTNPDAGCAREQRVLSHPLADSGFWRSHRLAGNPAGGPRGLEIESTGDAINVQQFAREMQARAQAAFHRLEIHLAELHPAARDKLILIQTLARNREFRPRELLRE